MLTICIGYDHREAIAYHVLAHSIMVRASKPVRIIPIMLSQLAGTYTRPRSPLQSTDFTYSRFLTPYLAGGGVSIFLDSDMLCLTDICELETIARSNLHSDVLVVKHDYEPNTESKFLKQPQTTYPCKNWSSVMVFNGHRMCVKKLTPEYVNQAEAMALHQFQWAQDVGSLDPAWNHLVGEYEPNLEAKIAHFTLGGPYFQGYDKCEYSGLWFAELQDMLNRESPSFYLDRVWI